MLVPPPPLAAQIVTHISGSQIANVSSGIDIAIFSASSIACGGEPVTPVRLEKPSPTIWRRNGSGATPTTPPLAYRFTFAIDASGRPRRIRQESGTTTPPPFYGDTSDLAPALAASRFGVGAPRQNCSISYIMATTPAAVAPMQALYELASLPERRAEAPEIADRLRPPGSDCLRGPGNPYSINYPAFETIDQAPGTRSWSFLAFDVDARGHARRVRVLGSSGYPGLDRAAVKALSANRYASGKGRSGCTFHFYRTGDPDADAPALPADVPPENEDGAACTIDRKTIPGLLNGNAYPPAFWRRRIEGVAALSYDTAPWGAIGNIKVLASEPDEAFGQIARNALTSARVGENEVGHRGCILHVRFRMPATR